METKINEVKPKSAETEIKISVGKRLEEERERAGYTKQELADMLKKFGFRGATRQGLLKNEKGDNSPSAVMIAFLAANGFDATCIITGSRAVVLNEKEGKLIADYRNALELWQSAIETTAMAVEKRKR